jgi:hypothetical protein
VEKVTGSESNMKEYISTYRGYDIYKYGPTHFEAAGARHGSIQSAVIYIDELLSS